MGSQEIEQMQFSMSLNESIVEDAALEWFWDGSLRFFGKGERHD
jgi:hypothetical protein